MFLLPYIARQGLLVTILWICEAPIVTEHFVSVDFEEPTNPDRAKLYFFINKSRENEGLSLQMETQRKQDHSKDVA